MAGGGWQVFGGVCGCGCEGGKEEWRGRGMGGDGKERGREKE